MMARNPRFTINNGVYHIMVRGNNRSTIFHDYSDYNKYIELINENRIKYEFELYHYVLMENHVHMIMMVTDHKDLCSIMKRIGVCYTAYYRKKYGGVGHFFQDRFKSFIIQKGKYLLECGRYIELNPVKANIVKTPEDYKWSSYNFYINNEKTEFLTKNPEFLILSDDESIRIEIYKDYVNKNYNEKRTEERFFRSGVYGAKDFIEILKTNFGLKPNWSHKGHPKNEKRIRTVPIH
jgi:putative transposase